MSGRIPQVARGAPGSAAPLAASDLAYPLDLVIGWPISRQTIRISDHHSNDVFRMVVHLAMPAWCEVQCGRDVDGAAFAIEAERFYAQSRTYRVADRSGAPVGWFEYEGKVSPFECAFRFYRAARSEAAFRVSQEGILKRRYLVATPDGAPVLRMRFPIFNFRRHCVIDRLTASLDRDDETLCLLGLSVVGVSEFARRQSDGTA